MAKRFTEPPPSISAHRPELSASVDRAIAKALALAPGERYQTATEFAQALSDAVASGPSRAIAEPPSRPVRRIVGAARWGVRRWLIAAVAVALVTISGVLGRRYWPGSADAVRGGRKMLAVLPFENLGPPEDQYFADGLTEELTSRLASLRGLGVISRTSANQYRKTTKSLTQIDQELGVDYVLEGSVRWERAGGGPGRVRVTPQLIRVSDDSHVWANRYDAEMGDVFAVEGAIGEQVAAAMEVTLEGGERQTLAAKPTENFEAYNYFLRGEAFRTTATEQASLRQAVEMYEKAVSLDPHFALAFARLSETHGLIYWAFYDRTAKRMEQAKGAAEAALRLEPDLPEGHMALGLYYYRARRDYDRALSEFSVALQRQPGSSDLFQARGFVQRRQGRYAEAAASFQRAVALDPRSPVKAWDLAQTYFPMRAYPEAERYLDRALALDPHWAVGYADRALLYVTWHGDVDRARRIAREAMTKTDPGQLVNRLRFHAASLVVPEAVQQAVLERLSVESFGGDTSEYLLWNADWHRQHHDLQRGRAYADSARAVLEVTVRERPGEAGFHLRLGLVYAELGRKADAIREATRAVELLPVSKDAVDGHNYLQDLAYVYVLVGEQDAAVTQLERLLAIPSDISVPLLRVHPMWDPLRSNPRFQRLLAGKS